MSSSTSRNRWKFRKALAIGLTTAAVAPATALAHFESPDPAPQTNIPYLSHGIGVTRPAPAAPQGGVTPTNLARSYVGPQEASLGISEREPIRPQTQTVEASGSGGFDTGDIFGLSILGVALAFAAALALSAVRGGPRTAQS